MANAYDITRTRRFRAFWSGISFPYFFLEKGPIRLWSSTHGSRNVTPNIHRLQAMRLERLV